ncbi:MAG: LysR family transcriptional regulator [Parasporobacterium sp.]|nr:LysR family transcriptional regulator [Parasporobacterium sp.]
MNKVQIDCFLAAAHTGSITSAANDLFLSPQVVSQHILNLEKQLDKALFIRSRNGVSLTPEGQHFYSYAVQWSGLYENTLRRIEEYYASISASFRIGISEYIDVMGQISGDIASFREKYPQISMTGSQDKNRVLLEKIRSGSLDAAIINEMQILSGDEFDYRPFAKEDLRLYISGELSRDLKHKKTEITMEELQELCRDLPHISTSYGAWESSDWEEISHRMTNFLGYDFSRHYEATNFRSCVLNLNTVPCSVVCDARFGYLPPENPFFSLPLKAETYLCILWHRKNENPLIQDFIRHMTDYYSEPTVLPPGPRNMIASSSEMD